MVGEERGEKGKNLEENSLKKPCVVRDKLSSELPGIQGKKKMLMANVLGCIPWKQSLRQGLRCTRYCEGEL